ncbi:MAG: DUF1559 domain-containing protein [Gemmataceae bacterium]
MTSQNSRSSLSISNRVAFTLVELLVVAGIIALLLSLLIPAVQRTREAASRAKCAGNLRQIGFALHHYEAVHTHFPPGRGMPQPAIFSAHAYLLPYTDQECLNSAIHFDLAPATYSLGNGTTYDGTANYPAASARVLLLACPSDVVDQVPGSFFGATNYAACTGTGSSANLDNADGVFFTGSSVRFEDISDGSSSTVAFGERPLGDGQDVLPVGPQLRIKLLPGGSVPTQQACETSGAWYGERGAKWIVGNYGNTLYNHALPPNALTCDCMNTQQQAAMMSARSRHEGGVNILYCDGDVQFVSNRINAAIWRALATRAGGETVD